MTDKVNSQGISQVLIDSLIDHVDKLLLENQSLHARIDELMWEYCPEYMTVEQLEEKEKHPKPAPEVKDDD